MGWFCKYGTQGDNRTYECFLRKFPFTLAYVQWTWSYFWNWSLHCPHTHTREPSRLIIYDWCWCTTLPRHLYYFYLRIPLARLASARIVTTWPLVPAGAWACFTIVCPVTLDPQNSHHTCFHNHFTIIDVFSRRTSLSMSASTILAGWTPVGWTLGSLQKQNSHC